MRIRATIQTAAACSIMWLSTTTAQAFTDSEARQAILELREQVKILSETNQRANLQLAKRIDQLEQELTRMRAQLEELGAKPGGQSASADKAERAQDSKEQAAFDGAMDLYREGKFKDSSESLAAFLTLYPDSVLAPTAQFYLGSSFYALKQYSQAISILKTMSGKYPDHPRAPDALLVVAGSEFELNSRAAAKATLQKIVKDYGSSAAAEAAKKRLELL